MVLQYIKKCGILVLMGGMIFVGLNGSLTIVQNDFLSELKLNQNSLDNLIKGKIAYVDSHTGKTQYVKEIAKSYASQLLEINAKLYAQNQSDRPSIMLIEKAVGLISKFMYSYADKSARLLAKKEKSILKIDFFESIFNQYEKNLAEIKTMPENIKRDAFASLLNIIESNTISAQTSSKKPQQEKTDNSNKTNSELDELAEELIREEENKKKHVAPLQSLIFIQENKSLKKSYEQENSVLKELIEEYEKNKIVDSAKVHELINKNKNFLINLFRVKQYSYDAKLKAILFDFRKKILSCLPENELLEYTKNAISYENTNLYSGILNLLISNYIENLKNENLQAAKSTKKHIDNIGKKLCDYLANHYNWTRKGMSKAEILKENGFSEIFYGLENPENSKIIDKLQRQFSKETLIEKFKNQWQWFVGLGILGLGIFAGAYKYYQSQQRK